MFVYRQDWDSLKEQLSNAKKYQTMWKNEVVKNQAQKQRIKELEATIQSHKENEKEFKEVKITQKILVDKCIAEEIIYLNSQGVRTEGSCCGHGKEKPNAIIKPSSNKKAKELGYETIFNEEYGYSGEWVITLKSKCNCNQ